MKKKDPEFKNPPSVPQNSSQNALGVIPEVRQFWQEVLDSPKPDPIDSLIAAFKRNQAISRLKYNPIDPQETGTAYYKVGKGYTREVSKDENFNFFHATEVLDLTKPEARQEFLKETIHKIHGWLKKLLPEEKYSRLFENFNDEASVKQMIRDELGKSAVRNRVEQCRGVIDRRYGPNALSSVRLDATRVRVPGIEERYLRELQDVTLACIHGAGALHWLLHEAPYVFPDFVDDPGFKVFYYNYMELRELSVSKGGRASKALEGIILAAQKIHEESGICDAIDLWAKLSGHKKENPLMISGYTIYYEDNPKTPGGRLCQKEGTKKAKPINFKTFQKNYIKKILST
jgi:hypothetical protein